MNLTDGLDGLATVPVILVASCFALISYVSGNMVFSGYLQIPYIEGVGEASIFCGAIIGACLGFLWFNAPPAKIFMGDTGSLTIGAILGSIALLTNSIFTLSIFSGIFIIESLSVMIQVGFFKITKKLFHRGKRVFLMAPLHHHFELKGVKEQKIVENFWKINILLVILGIVLKINL